MKHAVPALCRAFICCFCVQVPVSATDYYVDSIRGNDEWSGRYSAPQGGEDGPWCSLAAIQKVRFKVQPGDAILLRRGCTWHEPIEVGHGGAPGNPVRYGSYGDGPKPVLNLARKIVTWRVHQGAIYVAHVDFKVRQVFLDGAHMILAHHPNDGFLEIEQSPSPQSFIDHDLHLTAEQVVGADIRIRSREWSLDESRVESFADGTITVKYSRNANWHPQEVNTYYLANKLWMLDSPGEWFFDESAGKLYVWLPDSSSPEKHTIEGTQFEYGIKAGDGSGDPARFHIVLDGFEILYPAHSGVYIQDCRDFTVANMTIRHVGSMQFFNVFEESGNGIYVNSPRIDGDVQGRIVNNTIQHALHRGIQTLRSAGLEISGNTIENVGLVGKDQFSPVGSGTGICASLAGATNVLIRTNTLRNISWSGIVFSHGGCRIENNVLENVVNFLGDGGEIYTFGPNNGDGRIIGNIVRKSGDIGIYLDDRSHHMIVRDNTVIDAQHAYYLHNAHDNEVHNNTAFGCRFAVKVQEDQIVGQKGVTRNNTFERNTFVSRLPRGRETSAGMMMLSGWLGHVEFGSFDHSVYLCPDTDKLVLEHDEKWNWYDFDAWQAERSQDPHSRFLALPTGDLDATTVIMTNPGPQQRAMARPPGVAPEVPCFGLDGRTVAWPLPLSPYESKVLLLFHP